MCVGAINVLVTSGDTHKLLTCLQDDNALLRDFCPQYIDAYAHHLAQIKNTRLNTTGDYSFHCVRVCLSVCLSHHLAHIKNARLNSTGDYSIHCLCVCHLSVCHTTSHTSRTLDSIRPVSTPSIVCVSVCLSHHLAHIKNARLNSTGDCLYSTLYKLSLELPSVL